MNELIRLVIESTLIVLDGIQAAYNLGAQVRAIWCPAPPSPPAWCHPLAALADDLFSLSATDLRAIAPRGHRRATKAAIVAALVVMPL